MRLRAFLVAAFACVAAAGLVGSVSAQRPSPPMSLTPLGTYASGVFFDANAGIGAAEIPAYDWVSRRLFVVNAVQKRIDILSIQNPASPTKLGHIDVSALGTPNSVDTFLGLVAVAVEAPVKTNAGTVAFYRADGTPLGTVPAGALPDMLTFADNGRFVLVANEGEPDGPVDPMGTVSIIDLGGGVANATVSTADFTAFDGKALGAGVILAAGKAPSVDFEPEYLTASANGSTAWVTLQEANAVAELDVATAKFTALRGLGFKDHGAAGNALDASDRDNAINLCTWTNLFGMYQPDAIASFSVRGQTYLVTANEGDSRAADEARVSALTTGPGFPALLRQNQNLGRLTVNRTLGATAGVHNQLYVYGARSFSIWRDSGELVFDSGDQLERITSPFPGGPAPLPPLLLGPPVSAAPAATCPRAGAASPTPPLSTPFNSNHEEGNSFDTRSDNKGPEPEAVVLGTHDNRLYAFVGLERVGGIAVYDVTNPATPTFVTYANQRNFNAPVSIGGAPNPAAGDLGPEGIAFIPFWQSPTLRPLVVVSNEVSGTTTVYQLSGGPF